MREIRCGFFVGGCYMLIAVEKDFFFWGLNLQRDFFFLVGELRNLTSLLGGGRSDKLIV